MQGRGGRCARRTIAPVRGGRTSDRANQHDQRWLIGPLDRVIRSRHFSVVVIPLERGPGAPPVHRQLVGYLRRAVESGRMPPGARLPPIRDLAEQLGVHRETIAGAYRELAALGLAESGIGRGTFVRATARRSGEQTGEPSEPPQFASMLSRGAAATAALPLVDYTAPPDAVRLERLVPDPALYPVDDYRRVIERVLRDEGDALLDYGDPRGHEGLRRVLVERLARIGIETDPDTLVVTGGSTQALALAIRAFCDPGDTVAVESPTYPGLLATLAALGLRTVAVPLAADGVDLDTLDATLARGGIRLICTMPTFHNPTGHHDRSRSPPALAVDRRAARRPRPGGRLPAGPARARPRGAAAARARYAAARWSTSARSRRRCFRVRASAGWSRRRPWREPRRR